MNIFPDISTLDDPDAFVPDRHWFHGERIAWFDVADALPRYHASEDDSEPYRRGPAIEASFRATSTQS